MCIFLVRHRRLCEPSVHVAANSSVSAEHRRNPPAVMIQANGLEKVKVSLAVRLGRCWFQRSKGPRTSPLVHLSTMRIPPEHRTVRPSTTARNSPTPSIPWGSCTGRGPRTPLRFRTRTSTQPTGRGWRCFLHPRRTKTAGGETKMRGVGKAFASRWFLLFNV